MGTPQSTNTLPEPTELQKLRFDYAWKWFNFHAEQRTKMFNFMLLGLGIFATAVVATIEKKLFLEGVVLSLAAVILAVAFWLLDRRNSQLYIVAMDVLIDAEKTVVFGDEVQFLDRKSELVDFGIARRIALEEAREPVGIRGRWHGVLQGRHRYLMPFVVCVFAVLFALAAAQLHLLSTKPSSGPQPAGGQMVCCQANVLAGPGVGKPGVPPAGDTVPSAQTIPDVIAIDGTGTIGGWHWLLVIAGLAIATAGALVFFNGHKLIGSVAVAAGLATSVLPNLSVPLSAQFHFDPRIEAKLAEKIDLRIDRLLEVVRRSEPGMLASGRFGSFGEGVERFDCNEAANHQAITDVNIGLARARERKLQAIVLLVGGTDRKPLSQPLRKRFESNAGLARARVSEVERCLELNSTQPPAQPSRQPEVIRLVTGPSYTPGAQEAADVESKRMAEDREVRAFVIGVPVRGKP